MNNEDKKKSLVKRNELSSRKGDASQLQKGVENSSPDKYAISWRPLINPTALTVTGHAVETLLQIASPLRFNLALETPLSHTRAQHIYRSGVIFLRRRQKNWKFLRLTTVERNAGKYFVSIFIFTYFYFPFNSVFYYVILNDYSFIIIIIFNPNDVLLLNCSSLRIVQF